MSHQFRMLALAVVLATVSPVAAQEVNPEPPKPVEPPSTLPKSQHGDKTQNLDRLFEALKVAPDNESAKFVENRIWAIWLSSPSDTANLLMGRAKTAAEGKDLDLAIKLLDAIIELRPDFVEAWNRRATVYYNKKDFGRAIADIHEVLAREPRHFGALVRSWASSSRSWGTISARSRSIAARRRCIRASSASRI